MAQLFDNRVVRITGAGSFGPGWGHGRAAAVLFLASDQARFVTGTEIIVDGGMSVRCG